jgi:ABC-2 type transport system ATP-binding protein
MERVMIEVKELTKSFGSHLAVDQIDLSIAGTGVVGLLGPNGAGKTTTMRMLTGYLPQSSGSAVVAGFDVFEAPQEVKRRVGYLPETPPLYPELTVGEFLSFVAEIRGMTGTSARLRVGEVMNRVGLTGFEQRRLHALSKGYRQRVGLAAAIVHRPRVLILDEPTTGLDPAQLVGVRALIQSLGEESLVMLSTHVLSEVEALCSRVVVIHHGRIVGDGGVDELATKYGDGPWLLVELEGPFEVIQRGLAEIDDVLAVSPLEPRGELQRFSVRGGAQVPEAVARLALDRGWRIGQIAQQSASLEQLFLSLVGEGA